MVPEPVNRTNLRVLLFTTVPCVNWPVETALSNMQIVSCEALQDIVLKTDELHIEHGKQAVIDVAPIAVLYVPVGQA